MMTLESAITWIALDDGERYVSKLWKLALLTLSGGAFLKRMVAFERNS